jgi:Phage capsid family
MQMPAVLRDQPIPVRGDPDALNRASMRSFTRAAIAVGLSKFDKHISTTEYARKTWDDRSVDMLLRAASNPTSLANTPALAHVAVAFLSSLVPVSAGADLLGRGIGLNFNGAAQISVPGITAPSPAADFVAEGAPIPVTSAITSSGATLSPHKLAVITSLTHEMLVNTNAETLIRQALIESTGPALDKVLFSANAAATDRPAGLLNGIMALTPASAGQAKSEVLVDDLQTLGSAIAPVAGNSDIVLIASPDAAVALTLRLSQRVEWPVLTSASLAPKTVIAVAANAIVSAIDGAPIIDAASETTLVRDTQPTSVDDAMTAPMQYVGTVYQTDQIALRLRWPITWALRTPGGLAYMSGVNW